MPNFEKEKQIVLNYYKALENATPETIEQIIKEHVSEDYKWRSVYPFRKQLKNEISQDLSDVINVFYKPFWTAVKNIERRPEIFIGGDNEISDGKWIMQQGKLKGNFDAPFLGMKPSGKIVEMRYAEFHHVKDDKIVETSLILDVLGFMDSAGYKSFENETGHFYSYPGPIDRNGILIKDADPAEGKKTKDLLVKFVEEIGALNSQPFSEEKLIKVYENSFSKKMSWYGPKSIGASYTIPRYLEQHSMPFRKQLADKVFNGHVVRFAEGPFACFFGWPNLTNRPTGGWLGMPAFDKSCDMQVVDVYYRKDDKLYENWVWIDIPFWLSQQNIDIIGDTIKKHDK